MKKARLFLPGFLVHNRLWMPTRDNHCVPKRVLSVLFKAKFRDLMKQAGFTNRIPKKAWKCNWVVDAQAVGDNTEGVLKYLAPYVFRVAISDSRIVSLQNDQVTFRYTPSGTRETKLITLDAMEFIRRFLQHVLPTGLMKIRYYGFMSSGCPVSLSELAAMVQLANTESPVIKPPEPPAPLPPMPPFSCSCCGKPMQLREIWKNGRLIYEKTKRFLLAKKIE